MMPQLKAILAMGLVNWPQVRFYREQREIIESVATNNETVVVAGNQLGKDFVAAFICLTFFLCPQMYFPWSYVQEIEARRVREKKNERSGHRRRVVTTSVRESHLDVLWAEIGRYLATSEIPLLESRGGPLAVNSLDIRFTEEREVKKADNYLIGKVSGDSGEGLAGHHSNYSLFVVDEASGVSDTAYSMSQGWAKKKLIFGNPNPCSNFFYNAVKGGDILAK